ncbi:MAG: putative peptidoglycan glycosyltransferase FtsW [Spirochaetales bacterium]|nr:putative peptidoglycan glycosyltransferase FtsW [Spirochaetales bacterium]
MDWMRLWSAPKLHRTQQKQEDSMLVIILALTGLGAAALFSSSYNFCRTYLNDPLYMINRQIRWIVFGTILAIVIARIPKAAVKKSIPFLVIITLVLNLITAIPGIGYTSGGARRWIEIFGISLQFSEMAKIVVVLYIARMLEKNRLRLDDPVNALLPPFLVAIAFTLAVYLQNDFSTAVFIFALSLSLFFVSGADLKSILPVVIGSVVLFVLMLISKSYRIDRFMAWLRPELDPSGSGYQILKAREALRSGGFWGIGMGEGEVKTTLAAAQSDFVMAVVGEETGFVGILAITALLFLFLLEGYKMARRCGDLFSFYAIFGLVSSFFLQAMVNMAVVCGIFPVTGIPFPLFSSGGSSALTSFILFGLIFNFSYQEDEQ